MSTRQLARVLVVLLCISVLTQAHAAEERKVQFSIPAQRADRALREFARQAGLSVLFPYDKVSQTTANRVEGLLEIDEGLALLIAGTGLTAGIKEGGRLTVSVAEAEPAPAVEPARPGLLSRVLMAIGSTLKADSPQVDEPEPEQGIARLEEIVVTGSRIRQDAFQSAQPTTVLDGEMLVLLGLTNMGDAMTLVPANLGNWNPTSKPGGNESVPLNVFNGLNLANLRGLNPRYGSRTLTLVDSRRHMPTNQGDGVDLNLIPAILIDRTEIVTGGASASYGSGAIAGAINVLLDQDLDGLRTEVGFGATTRGDGNDRYSGFAWGGKVGSNGHLTLGAEVQNMDAIENCIEARSWCQRGAAIRENRDYQTNDEPNFVYRENVRLDMSSRGVFSAQGREFNAAGDALMTYQRAGAQQVGGDGQHVYLDTTLRTSVEREIGYLAWRHQLDDERQVFIESSVGDVRSWTPQDSIDLFSARIEPDNFYLNRLAENPCAGTPAACFLNKDFSAQADSVNDTRTHLRRVALGIGDRFGASSWTWDAWYQYGKADMLQVVHDSRHAQRMAFALDAVDDGAGNPVCRVTRDGLDGRFDGDPRLADGCVPLNAFGTQEIPAAAFDYSWGRILEDTRVEQHMLEFVASGDIARGFGGGPLRGAAGVSWRDESLANLADSSQLDYIRTDYNSQFGETFGGDIEVGEYFAELEVPLTDRVRVQLAGRSSHYQNTAGIGTPVQGSRFRYDIDTWKVNGSWTLSDRLRLRASRSRDLRAPNFRELYYGKVFPRGSNFGYCDNPWTGNRFEGWYTSTGDPCQAELRGSIDLQPEAADTTTLGLVLAAPSRGMKLAVDYYQIAIGNAITPANWSHTIDQCHQYQDAEYCALIQGELLNPADPVGGFARIDSVSSKSLNQLAYRTRGVDVAGDWTQAGLAGGTLSMRLLASHMIRQLVQPSATSPVLRDIAGVTGSPFGGFDWEAAPDWSLQWFTTFVRGPFGVTLQSRYVSKGIKDAALTGPHQSGYDPRSANSIDANRVPSYVVWGLSASWDFKVLGLEAQLFGSVQNLFDRDPPLSGTGIGGTNPVLFDTVGRRFRLGLRTEF